MQTKAKKIPVKTQLTLAGLSAQSLKLSDGTFVSNNKDEIGSDLVLGIEPLTQALYITQDVEVLYTPLTTFDNQVYSKLIKGVKLTPLKKRQHTGGSYYQITFDGGKTGWIDSQSATLKNPKLDQVQTFIKSKI